MNSGTALERCDAWEQMHLAFFPDYHDRWDTLTEMLDVALTDIDRPRILDLGCGPGGLTRRLAAALPHATIVGLDADSVLIGMANAATPANSAVSYLCALVGQGTAHALSDHAPFDAIVSSAFMHYFSPSGLRTLHRSLHGALTDRGVLITAERFVDDEAPTAVGEDPWRNWWVHTYDLLGEPDARSVGPEAADAREPITFDEYLQIASEAPLVARHRERSRFSTVVLFETSSNHTR